MSIKLTQCVGVVSLLLASICLSAQQDTSIYIQDMMVDPGQTFNVDIRVTDYDDIVSTSFSVNWDSMELRYVGLDNFPFGLSEDDAFSTMNASGGQVSFLYFDMSLMGNSLDDEAVLFTLQLEAIGANGTQTEISFGGNIEVVDVAGADTNTSLNVNFDSGIVTIGDISSVSEVVADAVQVDISPNPSANDVNVGLSVESGGEMNWTLTETNGQRVANGVTSLTPGRNTLKLENTHFKHTGAYILKMQIGDRVITKRILRVAP